MSIPQTVIIQPDSPSSIAHEDLHAILGIPEDQTRPLRLHHPAFRNFLLNEDRCTDSNVWVDEKQAHRTLAESCIQLMSAALKQDICDQRTPGVLATNVEIRKVEQSPPPDVQYACLYWVQHLQRSGIRRSSSSIPACAFPSLA
jgi:hypothetical protein